MNPKSKEHLESALYLLKEKIRTTNSREMVECITECLIDLASFIENNKEGNK